MIKLPKRDDPIYKEIETFADYELTNCIAYEMAIRNKKIESLLKSYLLTKNELIFSDDEPEFKLLKDYGFNSLALSCYRICMFSTSDINYNSGMIKGKYSDEILKHNNSKYSNIYSTEDRIFNDTYSTNGHWNIEEIEKDNINEEYIPSIEFGYQRPLLRIKKTKLFNTELNLSLPKDELIAYISKIKDNYDKDNSIIKISLELKGDNLEKSDDKHTQKKPKAEKYADWFYIYDYYQILKNDDKTKSNEKVFADIDAELFEYYDSKPDSNLLKYHYYSFENYKLIMKNMNYLINELGYKELITGVKNR